MKNYIWVIGFVIAILGLLGFLIWAGSKSALKTVSPEDPNRPVATLSETTADLGKMNVKEKKDYPFLISNDGKSDLIVTKISTSCDCTYVYIEDGDKKSPKFSMAGNIDSWKQIIPPGGAVILRVIYEPSIMPVEGKVERTVSFATNDPSNTKMEVKIIAEVSK